MIQLKFSYLLKQEARENTEQIAKPELPKKISNVSNSSTLCVPSTSHMIRNELRSTTKVNYNPSSRLSADSKTEINAIPLFKKAQSQSSILVNQHSTSNTKTTHENERKKLKKSRSVDKMELKKSKQIIRN